MRTILTAIATIIALIGVAVPQATASEYGYNYDTYGGLAFANDYIYVEDIPNQSEDQLGINRWEAAGIDIRWVTGDPFNGIDFVAQSDLVERTGWAAYASPLWEYVNRNGVWGWRTTDCTIYYQTGYPALKRQEIFTHEVGHCLGHMNHRDYYWSIMRTGTAGWETYYKPAPSDIDRMNDIYRHNG